MTETSSTPIAIDRQSVFEKAWSGRSGAMWGVAVLGLISGAAIGLIAPFFPVLVGATEFGAAAALVSKSLVIFSALGMTTGFGIGTAVGLAAGASAGAMEEGLKAAGIHATGKPIQPEPMSGRDTFRTYVNPKVGLAMSAIGMVGGAIMAAAFITLGGLTPGGGGGWALPAMETLLGGAASQSTLGVTSYFVGLMGSFGAMWSLNYPKIAAHFTTEAGNLISGKWFAREWGPEPAKAHSITTQGSEYGAEVQTKQFCKGERRFSGYQDLIAYREQCSEQSHLFTK